MDSASQPRDGGCGFGPDATPCKGRPADEEVARLLRTQAEFYFSDSNLARDARLKRILSKNKKRYLSFGQLLKFNRIRDIMREAKVGPGKHFQTLADALAGSRTLELNRLKNMVKRREEDARRESAAQLQRRMDECTCYLEGFGETVDQHQIATVFSEFGPIKCIRMPRFSSGLSQGYCFIEFADHSQMTRAVRPANLPQIRTALSLRDSARDIRLITYSIWSKNQNTLQVVI